jgi:hypothetical protein
VLAAATGCVELPRGAAQRSRTWINALLDVHCAGREYMGLREVEEAGKLVRVCVCVCMCVCVYVCVRVCERERERERESSAVVCTSTHLES